MLKRNGFSPDSHYQPSLQLLENVSIFRITVLLEIKNFPNWLVVESPVLMLDPNKTIFVNKSMRNKSVQYSGEKSRDNFIRKYCYNLKLCIRKFKELQYQHKSSCLAELEAVLSNLKDDIEII